MRSHDSLKGPRGQGCGDSLGQLVRSGSEPKAHREHRVRGQTADQTLTAQPLSLHTHTPTAPADRIVRTNARLRDSVIIASLCQRGRAKTNYLDD